MQTNIILYHHCRSLDSITLGEVKANPKYFDSDLRGGYYWLRREVGFNPLFLAVGNSEEDIRMTGYPNQWNRIIGTEIVGRRKDGSYIQKNVLRKRGEFPNYVLFSFDEVEGIFMDYGYWHLVLNANYKNYNISDYEKRLIFKPSWDKSKWLKKARKEPHSVQLVTCRLYLPDARGIFVRNQETKKVLEKMRFKNVKVKRIF